MAASLLAALLTAAAQAETPVSAPLPPGVDLSRPWKLVRVRDGAEVPVQIDRSDPPGAVWIHRGAADANEEYRLHPGTPSPFPAVEVTDADGKHLVASFRERKIFRYNSAPVEPPSGVDPVFTRSGYLHPIWTPDGRVLSNDFPAKHLHHHGIWFAWTSAEFEGRKSDFWNSKERQGRIEAVKVEETFSGPVFGGFRARHRWLNLNSLGGPKPALEEVWEVRAYAVEGVFVFDIVSTQTCASDAPLRIRKYHYGGLGFRGSGEWEGKDGCAFRTSEGRGRQDGHATTARWCVMSGTLGGRPASITFLGHPANFRFPQGMRIHPDEPFFNWCPAQGGDFSIEPGAPYVSRYRFVISDTVLPDAAAEAFWKGYAAPPVTLSAAR